MRVPLQSFDDDVTTCESAARATQMEPPGADDFSSSFFLS